MVGSQAEAVVDRLRPVVLKRKGRAVALWGEAGVGKSHAASRVLTAVACFHVSLPAALPLPHLVGALPVPNGLPAWPARGLERLSAGENMEVDNTVAALTALLTRLAPFVLHFEDLHEADAPRQDLLQLLATRVAQLRGVGLLVTSRLDPGPPFESRRLLPLTPAASRRLLEARTGVPLPGGASEWIYERAAGNPLFTLEYQRHLTRQGYLWSDGQQWRWRQPPSGFLPSTIEALIEQQITTAKSNDASRRALEARAYLAAETDPRTWQAVAQVQPQEFEAALLDLQRQGIMMGDAFAHPLFREVALGSITPASRRELARNAVTALSDHPGRAAQFVTDAALPGADALDLLKRAAAEAADPIQAARLNARAVQYASGPERTELALAAAKALGNADRPKAIRLLQALLTQKPQEREASYLLAAYYAEAGNAADADAILNRLEGEEEDQLQLLRQRIGLRFAMGDYAGVLELWDKRPPSARPAAEQAYYLAFSLLMLGQYVEAERVSATALHPGLPHLASARLLTTQGLACYYRQDPAAGPLLDAAVDEARSSDAPAYLAASLHNRSMHHEATNQIALMRLDVDEALQLYAQVGTSRHYASTLTKKARIEHELGNYESAEEAFLEARAILAASDAGQFLVTCDALLSMLYLDWQPPYGSVLSLKYAEQALKASRQLGARKQAQALCHLSLVESSLGRYERALELATRAQELAVTFHDPENYQVHHALAAALSGSGDSEAAAAAFLKAEALARADTWHVYAEKIGLEGDRLRGDVRSARARLAWFQRHGALNGAQLAMRYFPRLRESTPPTALAGNAALRLELLGPMRLTNDGSTWLVQGRKRRQLLALLLEARVSGRGEAPRIGLLSALYPDKDELQALSSLKALVHNVRRHFGTALVVTSADGYALGDCSSDAEEFLQGGAATLWRGHYQGAEEGLDGQVRDSLYLALSRRVEQLVDSDPEEAARLARLLIEAEPYATEYLKLKLTALNRAGSRRVERVYQAAQERMREVGELLPDRWTDFLHQQPA